MQLCLPLRARTDYSLSYPYYTRNGEELSRDVRGESEFGMLPGAGQCGGGDSDEWDELFPHTKNPAHPAG